MLPVPGLKFASRAQALYPPFILVPPVPLNPAFLIVFPSWDLVIPHLCALNEVSCGLSLSNRPDKKGLSTMSTLRSYLHCTAATAGRWVKPLTGIECPISGDCVNQEVPWWALLNFYPTFPSRRNGIYPPGKQFVSCTSRCLNFDRVQCLL